MNNKCKPSDLIGKKISVNKKDGNGKTVKGKIVDADDLNIHVETGPGKTEVIPTKDINDMDDLFTRTLKDRLGKE